MGWRSVLAGFVFHARYEALLDLREDRVSSRCHKRCRRGLACGSLRDSSTARHDAVGWTGGARAGQCSEFGRVVEARSAEAEAEGQQQHTPSQHCV